MHNTNEATRQYLPNHRTDVYLPLTYLLPHSRPELCHAAHPNVQVSVLI